MGQKSSQQKEIIQNHKKAGIRFTSVDNKSLRLFFQSQFTLDMEDEDLKYLNHLFETKVFLFFNKYYDTSHLLDSQQYLDETFERTIETIFPEIKDIEITDSDTDENQDEIIDDYFNFLSKKTNNETYNICKINYFLRSLKEISSGMELSEEFRKNIEITRELELYTLLNDNTNILYFVLIRIFRAYNSKLKKIVVYQVGLKTIDENMYTILASFLRTNPDIDSVSILEKNWKGLKHIEMPLETDFYENEERLENPIINRQHFFNFYQSLSARTNLIELRVLFFLSDYNFVMLSHVILINKNLRILQVRNVSRETDVQKKDLDFSYNELNMMGENLRDEIFIFFNYLSKLKELEQFYLTHFSFNSEINFMACEACKVLKKLKVLSLDKNQAIINNDTTALEQFNFENSNLIKLNIGYCYLSMIRRFDYILNTDMLQEVNIGVLDFVSFSSFIRFIPITCLERITLTLNKPSEIRSIPFLFEQIYTHAFKSRTLRFLYILNAYSNKTYNDNLMNLHLSKLIEKMKENNSLRKLSFKKPCILYTSIKENEAEKENGYRTFRYINKRDYNLCAIVILILRSVFKYDQIEDHGFLSSRERNDTVYTGLVEANGKIRDKYIFYMKIFKNIVHFKFANYRKIVLE